MQFDQARMLADLFVHQRLRHGRLVGLVVAVTAIADHVDDDIALKGFTVLDRDFGDEYAGFGIVAVDVKNRRLHHPRDLGAVGARAHVARVTGGEADLVVDDDVNRAAGAVTARLAHVEGFHHHALAGKGRIAVDQHRQHVVGGAIVEAALARAHRALDHRVDDFQMRRVKRQGEVHRPRVGIDIRRKSLVILDVVVVAVAELYPAFELVEEVARHLAENIGQYVEASAMRHADDHLVGAGYAGLLHHPVENRDQRLSTLEREALLPDIAGVQILFQVFRRDHAIQNPVAPAFAKVGPRQRGFELYLDPALLRTVLHVHILGADRAAINLFEPTDDVAQRRVFDAEQRAGVELGIEIGFGELVARQRHLLDLGNRHHFQRIEFCAFVAVDPVGIDQLQHRHLFGVVRVQVGHDRDAVTAPGSHRLAHLRLDGKVILVRGQLAVFQRRKPAAPVFVDFLAVEVACVEFLDEDRIGAVEITLLLQFLHTHSCLPVGHGVRGGVAIQP